MKYGEAKVILRNIIGEYNLDDLQWRAVEKAISTFNKIEQGTLIELPCKVGDRLYVIADGIWHCQQVWQFRYDSCGLFVKTVGIYPYDFEWGETAFLTREEAEKRLKELQE